MKKLLVIVTTFPIMFGSCGKDKAVGTLDLLYQPWQLIEVQADGQTPRSIPPSQKITVFFTRDGRIQYNENGYDGACCLPRRYARQVQLIQVDYSTDQPDYCKYIDMLCKNEYQGGSSAWTIDRIDSRVLQLRIGNKLLIHQPAN